MAVPGCAQQLRRVAFLEHVAPHLLAQLEQVAFVQRVERGAVLFAAGDTADHLFVLLDGALKVHTRGADGSDSVLALAGPGYSLGDVSMVDRGPRSAAATALVDSKLLAVPIAAVRDLLDRHRSALWIVAEGLAVRVRTLTAQQADPASLDLPRRLAKLLLDSATDERDRTVVRLPIPRRELADLLGVPEPALQQALDGLAAQGWIEDGEQAITLADTGTLRRFVSS